MILKNLIELKNVTKTFGNGETAVKALDNISFRIGNGEFIAVLGKSGSGKSTMLNILGCLDTPTDGVYYLNGENVASMSPSQLCDIRAEQIGFIFQGFNLIPSLTACENVELPLIYRGIPGSKRKKIAKDALDRVGLLNRARHLPCELSGGQKQRVAIARAIACDPPIILADEPTGNLDSTAGKQITDMLRSLNESGKTIIVITHDNSAAALFDRRIIIDDGKVTDDIKEL